MLRAPASVNPAGTQFMKSATDIVDVNNAFTAAEARLVQRDRHKAELTEALTIAENERDRDAGRG